MKTKIPKPDTNSQHLYTKFAWNLRKTLILGASISINAAFLFLLGVMPIGV